MILLNIKENNIKAHYGGGGGYNALGPNYPKDNSMQVSPLEDDYPRSNSPRCNSPGSIPGILLNGTVVS